MNLCGCEAHAEEGATHAKAGATLAIDGVHVGVGGQQQLRHLHSAAPCGVVQWGENVQRPWADTDSEQHFRNVCGGWGMVGGLHVRSRVNVSFG